MTDNGKSSTLNSLEHIRLRPGIYLNLLPGAIYTILKEIINNSVDEHLLGTGRRVDINLSAEGSVTVRDFGRGLALETLVETVSNPTGKLKSNLFPLSPGARGVSLITVNALSAHFTVTTYRDGQMAAATFEKGVLINSYTSDSNEKNGTMVEFLPDKEFFGDFIFNHECLRKIMWRYACLNGGLEFLFNGELFCSQKGLLDLLDMEIGDGLLYTPPYYKDDLLEIALTHVNSSSATYFSFVNGNYTVGGGRHLSAFCEGFLEGVNEFYGKQFTSKIVLEGVIAAIAVKVIEPHLDKKTYHDKLIYLENYSDVANRVCRFVADCLQSDSALAKAMLNKINRNERTEARYSSR